MKGIVNATARLVRAAQKAYVRKWSFLVLFAVVFIGTLATLAKLDLLPDAPVAAATPAVALAASQSGVASTSAAVATVPEMPTSIVIPKIGLSVTVADPDTTD